MKVNTKNNHYTKSILFNIDLHFIEYKIYKDWFFFITLIFFFFLPIWKINCNTKNTHNAIKKTIWKIHFKICLKKWNYVKLFSSRWTNFFDKNNIAKNQFLIPQLRGMHLL